MEKSELNKRLFDAINKVIWGSTTIEKQLAADECEKICLQHTIDCNMQLVDALIKIKSGL